MIEWAYTNTQKINRIGYNREVKAMYIDFVGSEIDSAYVGVPEALFKAFVIAKSIDDFFAQFVDSYYDVVNQPVTNYIDDNKISRISDN